MWNASAWLTQASTSRMSPLSRNRPMKAMAVSATKSVPGGRPAMSGPTTGTVPSRVGSVSTARKGRIEPTDTTSATAPTSISATVAHPWRRRRGDRLRYSARRASPLVMVDNGRVGSFMPN